MIESIHVGNYGTAFLEILVGSSAWPAEEKYKTLVPVTKLMSPDDARKWEHIQTVTIFGAFAGSGSTVNERTRTTFLEWGSVIDAICLNHCSSVDEPYPLPPLMVRGTLLV